MTRVHRHVFDGLLPLLGLAVACGGDRGSTARGMDAGSPGGHGQAHAGGANGLDGGGGGAGGKGGGSGGRLATGAGGSGVGDGGTGATGAAGRTNGGSSGGATGAGGSAGTDGAGGGPGDAGGSASEWRPFSDDSPWNTPIAANPELEPDSTTLVNDFRTSSPYGEHLDVNIGGFSIPLYEATAATPTVKVTCDLGGEGFMGTNGSNATAQVPIPMGAAPDPESDHHLLIIDRGRRLEWGMWNTRLESGAWHCGLGATADLAGTGVRPYKPTNPTWYTSHGARACGFPLIAGLIRREEIDAGHIEHALVVAYPHIRAGFYTSPASTAQAKVGTDSISTRGIPCGGRIQLDPAINLDTLGLPPGGRAVAEALQRYGAYVGDYSGSLSLYAENSPEAQAHWKGLLDTYVLQNKVDLSRLRVLKLGKLTDDGNGN
jgi:hypothetical protein